MQTRVGKSFLSSVKKGFSSNNPFKLIKYDYNSKEDYEIFKNVIIENLQYSSLQYSIPNLHNEVNINNIDALKVYFSQPDKEAYIKKAFQFVTNHWDKSSTGYCKIIDQETDKVAGNAGWILYNVSDNGVINDLERGIHLRKDYRSEDNKTLNSKKIGVGAKVMRLIIDNFEENKDKINPEGTLVSSILKNNTRSQAFTQKHLLNVGEPTREQNGCYKWEIKNKEFIERMPAIKERLDKTINR